MFTHLSLPLLVCFHDSVCFLFTSLLLSSFAPQSPALPPHLAPISFLLHSASISQPHHHLARKGLEEPALRFLSQEISAPKDLKASVLRPLPVISLQWEKGGVCEYFYKKKNHIELYIGWLLKCFGFENQPEGILMKQRMHQGHPLW